MKIHKYYIIPMIVLFVLISAEIKAQLPHDDGKYFSGMNMMDWKGTASLKTVSGKIIIDSNSTIKLNNITMMHKIYYLDTLGTGARNLMLYFGPYWYNPANGTKKPANGQSVTLTGIKTLMMNPPMFAVYTINGVQWRPSNGIPPWYGGMMIKNSTDTTRIYCYTDSLTYFKMSPGSMGSGMMGNGMNWSDSLKVEMFEMIADSLLYMNGTKAAMGFYTNTFDMRGSSMMKGTGMGGGMMTYMKSITMRFHINADSLSHHGMTMNNVILKYLDTDNSWKTVPGQSLNSNTGIISFASTNIYPYYSVVSSTAVSVEKTEDIPSNYILKQNYPNPFNPTTNISFSIPQKSFVSVIVFNVIGQQVAELVNGIKEAGNYNITFNAAGLTSGIYLYEIKAENFNSVKKMLLLK